MRAMTAVGALALAAFLAVAPARAQTIQAPLPVPVGKAQGGNKALMEDWVRKKTQVRDQILADLRRQGALPRDGQVTFEATVSPDPKAPGKSVVRIQSLTISEQHAPAAKGQPDSIFGPRTPGGQTQYENQPIPGGPLVVRETVTIVSGRPQAPPAKP